MSDDVWFRSTKTPPVRNELHASVPTGVRVYAIGDIHGCSGLLDRLLATIEREISAHPAPEPMIVFLGDYIDRGPRSADVLSRLAHGSLTTPTVALRGNHEEMLLRFLGDPTYLGAWRQFGGLETLHSFGIDVSHLLSEDDYQRARTQLQSMLSPELVAFIGETKMHVSVGDYFFCHAGVRPGVTLSAQRPEDLLWIRDEFLASSADHGKVIVHGHSPVEQPELKPNRINVDTGAYLTGVLTCVVLEGNTRRFLTS